jgi:predicted transcriptional regulator
LDQQTVLEAAIQAVAIVVALRALTGTSRRGVTYARA